MTKFLWYLSLPLFLACCASSSGGWPVREYDSFILEESFEPYPGIAVYRYEHTLSGLKVLLSPKKGSGVVAYTTTYDVGSRLEEKGRTGLAHLFEHMMFRGTPSFPEPFKTLGEWGGHYNAFTTQDMTHFWEVVPKDLFPLAAKFESERMRRLQLTPEVFNTERGAVVSERKMRTEDSPHGRLHWELYQTAYDDHPYKTGVIGWQEDLDKMKYEDAIAFYQRFYAPNRAVISIAGDFDIKEALALLSANYGSFRKTEFTEPKIPEEHIARPDRRRVVHVKTENVYLADTIFSKPMSDPSIPGQILMCHLILDDNLGLLAEELVQKGIAKSVSGDCSGAVDPDLAGFIIVGNPGVSVKKLENAYNHALAKFPKWVDAEKVQSLKLYYLRGLLESLRDPLELAKEFGTNQVLVKDPLHSFKQIDLIQKVTLEDVQKAWHNWEHHAKTRVIISPSAKTDPFRKVVAGKEVGK